MDLKKSEFLKAFCNLFFSATSKTWTRTLDSDPEKTGPRTIYTLKNLDPKKHEINIGLKFMSDFRGLCFIKTMRFFCLKVRVPTDI